MLYMPIGGRVEHTAQNPSALPTNPLSAKEHVKNCPNGKVRALVKLTNKVFLANRQFNAELKADWLKNISKWRSEVLS